MAHGRKVRAQKNAVNCATRPGRPAEGSGGLSPPGLFPPGPVLILVVDQDPHRGAVQILELAAPERPQERHEAEQAEQERGRDQYEQDVHPKGRPPPRRRRSAFRVTRMDDADMAAAATIGVTRPATASGIASAL